MKKLLILGAPFECCQGGAEYQYKILEQHLDGIYSINYLFRYPSRVYQRNYITYDYFFRKNYNAFIWTDFFKIYNLISRFSPDIIYKRGVNYITAVGVRYANIHKKKMVIHIALKEDVEPFKLQFKGSSFLEFSNKTLGKYAIKNTDRIICQARYQRDLLEKNYKRKCDLILPNFHPVPENGIGKTFPIKIVWVANFKRWKRPELFVELAERLQHRSDVKFIMIGRAGASDWEKRLFDRMNRITNFQYLGELPIRKVNEILSRSHIFVNTSRYEGFPNTYIQAWAREIPVVGLNVDPDGFIEQQKIGFHSRTFDQMLKDIQLLINDQNLRDEMGRRAKAFALKTFSVSNIQQLMNLLE